MPEPAPDPDTSVATLGNGVRVLVIRLPFVQSVSVSVFVRTGSRNESRRRNGISHLVEHMAFKGTHERSCQQINLDAERLGAEVNAHTDKDHTAFHMHGLAEHAPEFLRMLGDIVQNASFPEAELERERQVIVQEYIEEEDDALASVYKLFDKTCFGTHPLAQPVLGTRGNLQRFTRADLLGYMQSQYTGANLIVGVAGNVDPEAIVTHAQAAFGAVPHGSENVVAPPSYIGGVKARRQAGCGQTHVVLGFPIPTLHDEHQPSVVAAALFGEGMSSPLLDRIRERRGLVYHAAGFAEVTDLCGLFMVEASMAPEHLDEFFVELGALLLAHAQATDPVGLQRARNQIAVRMLRDQEWPFRRLEDAAQDLFVFGHVRSRSELIACVQAVTAAQVRDAFERMLGFPASVAIAGKLGAGPPERLLELVTQRRRIGESSGNVSSASALLSRLWQDGVKYAGDQLDPGGTRNAG